mgnify:CR=1 FL=1
MPVDVVIGDRKIRLLPTNEWKKAGEVITNINDIKVLTDQLEKDHNIGLGVYLHRKDIKLFY